jgi:small redox-active disulfide protein 2
MKRVQVLGPGCPDCDQFCRNAEEAVKALGIEASVEKITDVDQILEFDVLMTPALAIDGQVMAVGKALTVEEIRAYLVEDSK